MSTHFSCWLFAGHFTVTKSWLLLLLLCGLSSGGMLGIFSEFCFTQRPG